MEAETLSPVIFTKVSAKSLVRKAVKLFHIGSAVCGGYRNDGDVGLLHVGARYYEVETGRWVQKDKVLGFIFSSITLNYYVYCNNNPINYIDPLGNIAWKPILLIVAIVAIAVCVGVYVYYRTRDKDTAVEAGATVPSYTVPGSELTGPVQAAPDMARIRHIDNAGTTNQLSAPGSEYTHEFDRVLEERKKEPQYIIKQYIGFR
jgi:hypothetical protein